MATATILAVDDELINLEIIKHALEPLCNVVTAQSGEEAIQFCNQALPDLVLMDVRMGEVSGLDACLRIKTSEKTRDIPVIFVTGSEGVEEESCWQAGAVDFISKPINTNTLLNRVKAHLTLKLQTDFLKQLAFLDGLTGIFNRRYFDSHLQRCLGYAQRNSSPLALLLIDIDYFKKYNDAYGHLAGDDCLRKIATALNQSLRRPADILARYGGEEFAVILPDTDDSGAEILARNMLEDISRQNIPHKYSPLGLVSVSIGISLKNDNENDPQALIERADKGLYHAKNAGRNQYSIA
jgi:diguanylate cyclase (GGDEF)-like protein